MYTIYLMKEPIISCSYVLKSLHFLRLLRLLYGFHLSVSGKRYQDMKHHKLDGWLKIQVKTDIEIDIVNLMVG